MESKRKQELIGFYEENHREWFYWYDIEDYMHLKYHINTVIKGKTDIR